MTVTVRASVAEPGLADLLCFDLGVERFAIPLSVVEEIVDACEIESTRHSGAALGVLRVRGDVLPVYEAMHVLRAARTNAQPLAVILASSRAFVAVLVDGAEAASRVNLDSLRTPPALLSADRVVEGVLRVGTRWVGLLNPGAFVDALTFDLDSTKRSEPRSDGR